MSCHPMFVFRCEGLMKIIVPVESNPVTADGIRVKKRFYCSTSLRMSHP